MTVGIELILLDDPDFQRLSPDVRWFYVALSLEVLDSGHQGRRLEFESILKLAGMNKESAINAIDRLEEVGLLIREGGRKLNLPKAELHFRRYSERNESIAPNDRKDQVLEVFRHWQNVHEKHQFRLTPVRRKMIRARLQDGYTVDQIKQAIEGCKISPYHQGENDRRTVYDDLELICRTPDNLERFMGYKSNQERLEMEEKKTRRRLVSPVATGRAQIIQNFRNRQEEQETLQLEFDPE